MPEASIDAGPRLSFGRLPKAQRVTFACISGHGACQWKVDGEVRPIEILYFHPLRFTYDEMKYELIQLVCFKETAAQSAEPINV
ncbi:unnamed protein product, partial [Iphiclides podalirius]